MDLQRAARIRVELVGDIPVDDRERLLDAERTAVGAVRGERLVHVGDREHPHRQIEVAGFERAGVAGAVELLVVVGGQVGERREAGRPLEDPQRVDGVGLDRPEFLDGSA